MKSSKGNITALKQSLKVFLLFLVIANTSCKKEVAEFDPNYIGHWYSEDYFNSSRNYSDYFIIDSNSTGRFSRGGSCGEDCRLFWEGNIYKRGNHLIIINHLERHRIKIITPPTKIDSFPIPSAYHSPNGLPQTAYSTMKLELSLGTLYKL